MFTEGYAATAGDALIRRELCATATITGVGLVLLLAKASTSASRTHGAALGYPVLRSQARHWLAVAALGVVGAAVLTVGGEALALALRGAALPMVVAASGALGLS